MPKPANRLGKGLSALISSSETAAKPVGPPTMNPSTESMSNPVVELDVERIRANPRQPRTAFDTARLNELAESIHSTGLLQPILVRRAEDGDLELVAGERRLRAARLAGLSTVPAIVRELSDSESLEVALLENLQREDLGPLERAAAYQQYLETFGGAVEDLARKMCESRANISNYLRLLKLHPEVCYMLGNGELGMGQARALAGLTDSQRQLALAKLAARRNLSVRQVEELVRRAASETQGHPVEPEIERASARTHLSGVEETLSRELGLRVRIMPGRKKNSGRMVIRYNGLEEFDRIAERLGGRVHLD